MRISVIGVLVSLLLAFSVRDDAEAQETGHVTLPGAVWAIVPPPGFSVITEPVAAFEHPSGAIIVLRDSPKQPVTKAEFLPGGERPAGLDELTEVTVDGKHGFFAIVHHQERQTTSMILTVEGAQSNGNIVAVIPDAAGSAVPANAVREAVLSLVERPKTADERLAELPYTLGETSGMRLAKYLPSGVITLTDGPLDNLEFGSDQSFAVLSSAATGGVKFDPTAALVGMVGRVTKQYPDAEILSSKVVNSPEGDIGEVRFERTTMGSRLVVGGVHWMKALGETRAIFLEGQHPRGDEVAFAKLRRICDGLGEK